MGITASRNEVASLIGAQTAGDGSKSVFSGAVFDSREVRGGELFVALKGAAHHGHAFLNMARERGASLFLVEDEGLFAQFAEPERLLVVPDTLQAFWKLATWWREQTGVKEIAVTGSVGKTSTKEILASLLMRHALGTYSLKSHNNHVGVPYTLCRIVRGHRWAVLEMGMNHAGELRSLTQVGRPDVAVITKIGPAHLEYFGSLERIADAKCEILEGLPPDGLAVLNGDDQVLRAALERNFPSPRFRVVWFGEGKESYCQIAGMRSHGLRGVEARFKIGDELVDVHLPLAGAHNVHNAAAAIAAARQIFPEIGIDLIRSALASMRPPDMRLAVKHLTEGRQLLDDSYNASPLAMSGTIAIAREMREQGRRIAFIVGDMLELGADAETFHRKLGEELAASQPEFVIYVGAFGEAVLNAARGANIPATLAESPEAAAHLATKRPFDLLVVKGSRGVGLDRAVKVLEELYGAPLKPPYEDSQDDDTLNEVLQKR